MAGIYIHIPFCKQACVYCNFHFSTSVKLKNDFIQALLDKNIIKAFRKIDSEEPIKLLERIFNENIRNNHV